MFVAFVIVIVLAVVIGALALNGYANYVMFSGWRDIFKLYGDVIRADRKRREGEAARKRDVGNAAPRT